MKKITSIISMVVLALIITSCAEKEKVDTSQAPAEIVQAIEMSFQLSKELTDLQVNAGADKILDQSEIEAIGQLFQKLAIINNSNLKTYEKDKYFIALSKERKNEFNELAEKVVFLKDCQGYDDLGLAIQKFAIEVKDVTELPAEEVVIKEPAPLEQPDSLAVDLEE
ncbi:hypothetical protein ACFLRI_00290 [Bacteroidota bacterium]